MVGYLGATHRRVGQGKMISSKMGRLGYFHLTSVPNLKFISTKSNMRLAAVTHTCVYLEEDGI
jgi:hypothetical protein